MTDLRDWAEMIITRLFPARTPSESEIKAVLPALTAIRAEAAATERDELIAALRGVVRVADRRTDEFDRARAALAKADKP
jgi:hypothetical protein